MTTGSKAAFEGLADGYCVESITLTAAALPCCSSFSLQAVHLLLQVQHLLLLPLHCLTLLKHVSLLVCHFAAQGLVLLLETLYCGSILHKHRLCHCDTPTHYATSFLAVLVHDKNDLSI